MIRRIALTGGIATGKSYVASKIREAGVPIVDADVLSREVVAPAVSCGTSSATLSRGSLNPPPRRRARAAP